MGKYKIRGEEFTNKKDLAYYLGVSLDTVNKYFKEHGIEKGIKLLDKIPYTDPKKVRMCYKLDGKTFNNSKDLAEYLEVTVVTVDRWRHEGLDSCVKKHRNRHVKINGVTYKSLAEYARQTSQSYATVKYRHNQGVLGEKVAPARYNVNGKKFNSLGEVADYLGCKKYRLQRIMAEAGSLDGAVQKINEIKAKEELRKAKKNPGHYMVEGQKFNKITDVAKYLGLRVSRLKRIIDNEGSLDGAVKKINEIKSKEKEHKER